MSKTPLPKRIGQTLAVLQHMSDLTLEWALKQTRRATDSAGDADKDEGTLRKRFRSGVKFVTDLWDEYVHDYGAMKRK